MLKSETVYALPTLEPYFPRAIAYNLLGQVHRNVLREGLQSTRTFRYTEKHLQCVWFDSNLRPLTLRSHDGEEITVLDPGRWNSEAGPDFLDATMLVGPTQRRMRGDVEIHIRSADWLHHGHKDDPRYSNVRLHVCYYPDPLDKKQLPPGTLQTSLSRALATKPLFDFGQIDISAYPAEQAIGPANFRMFSTWTFQQKLQLVEAAGEERLRHKSACFLNAMQHTEPAQLLYEEVMASLGYKYNKTPFRELARRVTLKTLNGGDVNSPLDRYAFLLGVSGLFPESAHAAWDEETKRLVRALWDTWWKHKDAWSRRTMNNDMWATTKGRPANNPIRRLAAAALLFSPGEPLETFAMQCLENDIESASRRIMARLTSLSDAYWDHRFSFEGERTEKPSKLIGTQRAASIFTNVIIPTVVALGGEPDAVRTLLHTLPDEGHNAVTRETARALFGPECHESWQRDGLRQQGLIQLFEDFYLNDRSHEVAAAVPAEWTSE